MKAGRELDALVAEVVMELRPDEWPYVCHAEEHNLDDRVWCYDCCDSVRNRGHIPPPYSTSITDAWLVVEKMIEIGEAFCCALNYDEKIEQWCLVMRKHDEVVNHDYWPWADTAPLAICLAALKAVGYEVPA